MTTKRNNKKTTNKAEASDTYNKDSILKLAKLSGSPIKTSTASLNGVYLIPVESEKGTPIILRELSGLIGSFPVIESITSIPKKALFGAEKVRELLSSIGGSNKEINETYDKAVNIVNSFRKAKGNNKPFGNLNGIKRLVGEIKKGNIISFGLYKGSSVPKN